MKATTPYEEHANRCRTLAGQAASTEDRDILLKIADTWDWIARDYDQLDAPEVKIGGILAKPAR